MDNPVPARLASLRRPAHASLSSRISRSTSLMEGGAPAPGDHPNGAAAGLLLPGVPEQQQRNPSTLTVGYRGHESIFVPNSVRADSTDEAKSILNSLLAKRRIILMDINKSELRDASDAERFGSKNSEDSENSPMILQLRDALCMDTQARSSTMHGSVQAMLRCTPCLADALSVCSARDVEMLARECSAFFVTEETEHVVARCGDSISECFIVVKGAVDSYSDSDNTFAMLERAAQPDVYINGFVESFSSGSGLGFHILSGTSVWAADYVARNSSFICSVPVTAVLQYLGTRGLRASDAMECFWKYYKLWGLVYDGGEGAMRTSEPLFMKARYLRDEFGLLQGVVPEAPHPLDVMNCSRVCYYSAGNALFEQGDERDSLFVILVGECSICRQFPKWVENIPSEVSIGLTLYPGDFSFMDGEAESWIGEALRLYSERQGLMNFTGDDEAEDVEEVYRRLFLSKLKSREKHHTFGVHKNSLVATTRVEAVRIPLSAVANSKDLFRELLRIALRKYALALLPDEEIVRKYHKDRIWSMQKAKLICKTLDPAHTKNIKIIPPENFSVKAPLRRPGDGLSDDSSDSGASLEDVGLVFGDRGDSDSASEDLASPTSSDTSYSSSSAPSIARRVAPARRMSTLSSRFNAKNSADGAPTAPPHAFALGTGASLGSRIKNFVAASSQSEPQTNELTTGKGDSVILQQKPKRPPAPKRSSNTSSSAQHRRIKDPQSTKVGKKGSKPDAASTKRVKSRRSSNIVSSARTVRSGETVELMMQAAEETAEYYVQKYRAMKSEMEAFNRRHNARKGIMGASMGFRGRATTVGANSLAPISEQAGGGAASLTVSFREGSISGASSSSESPQPPRSSLSMPPHRSRSIYRSKLERVDEAVQFLAEAV